MAIIRGWFDKFGHATGTLLPTPTYWRRITRLHLIWWRLDDKTAIIRTQSFLSYQYRCHFKVLFTQLLYCQARSQAYLFLNAWYKMGLWSKRRVTWLTDAIHYDTASCKKPATISAADNIFWWSKYHLSLLLMPPLIGCTNIQSISPCAIGNPLL